MFEVIYQWSLRFSKMDIQSQYSDMISESIFGYLMFVLELSEEFINRGLNGVGLMTVSPTSLK